MHNTDLVFEEQLFRCLRSLTAARLAAVARGDFPHARALGHERQLYRALLARPAEYPAINILSAA